MIGIVESQKIVEVIAGIGNIAGAVMADGKIDIADMSQLIPAGQVVMQLSGIAYADLGKEMKDLDGAEREALIGAFQEKFDIPQDNIELVVESGLSLINRQVGVVQDAILLVKSLKPKA